MPPKYCRSAGPWVPACAGMTKTFPFSGRFSGLVGSGSLYPVGGLCGGSAHLSLSKGHSQTRDIVTQMVGQAHHERGMSRGSAHPEPVEGSARQAHHERGM